MDAEQIYREITVAGEAWADAEAAASLLEETRKSMLSKLMTECAAPSVGAKEMYALADPQYKTFVEGMVKARKAANKARVRYDSARILADLRRSEESTRRAEMTMR